MKAKLKEQLTDEKIKELAENPDTKVKIGDPWWIIVLKVVAYVAGLVLAGYGTASAAVYMAMV